VAKLRVGLAPADEAEIARALTRGAAEAVSRALAAAAPAVRERVGALAADAVRASPAYASLLNGELRNELGIVDAGPVLEAVVRNLREGARATSLGARAGPGGLTGGMTVELVKGDYSEVLGATGASFPSERGETIPWLAWLTLGGQVAAVGTHHYVARASRRSRTGLGLMVRGGTWSVPSAFAGDAGDNWLTRAIAAVGPAASLAVGQEISRRL